MNKPAAYMSIYIDDEGDKSTMFCTHKDQYIENQIPLYTHPANACKHGVDDGACKECYLESSNPYKAITNKKIEPTAVSYTHPVKELTDEEIFSIAIDCTYGGDLHADKFAKAILRKAQENG